MPRAKKVAAPPGDFLRKTSSQLLCRRYCGRFGSPHCQRRRGRLAVAAPGVAQFDGLSMRRGAVGGCPLLLAPLQ